MIRIIAVIALVSLAACGGKFKELPMVKAGDPVFQLNPDRWTASTNDLTTPPGDGTSKPASDLVRPL